MVSSRYLEDMHTPAKLLPSIRSRIVSFFVFFGALVCIFSAASFALFQRGDVFSGLTVVVVFVAILAFVVRRMTDFLIQDAHQVCAVHGCRLDETEAIGTLSDFMYYIAHIVRTPVNAIRWSVESLKNEDEGEVNEGQREVLDTLESSAVKLAAVTSDLQDALLVIRGESIHMRSGPVDVPTIIDRAAGRMAVQLRRKGLKLDWVHPEKPLPQVRCDASRVEQVILVLLDNAVKYTPPGRRIAILADQDGENLMISVEDEGIGIGKKEQSRIFRAFFRGEEARGLWVDGKGVGLMLAKAIVEGCGGKMWFTSHKGRGTAMRFSLPIIP